MHSDELRKLNEGIEDPALYKIINELITRSDLHTAAIAAMHEPGVCSQLDNDMALLTHHVAPKKKYTVEDIKVDVHTGYAKWATVRCREYLWDHRGWRVSGERYDYYTPTADAIAVGLRATGNVPEVEQ